MRRRRLAEFGRSRTGRVKKCFARSGDTSNLEVGNLKNVRSSLIWLALIALMLPVAAVALNSLLPAILALAIIFGAFAIIFRPKR